MTKQKKRTAYKGFDRNFRCRGFQYETGKKYEHDGDIEQCASGFHAYPMPLGVFSCYPPGGGSKYAIVKQHGDMCGDNEKMASPKISIGATLSFGELAKAHIDLVLKKCKKSKGRHLTGNYSAASNTGYYSAASNTGNYSAASNTGNRSAASNTGYYSAASNTGNYSAASNTGYYSAASNTGDRSAASNTGNYSAASNAGYYSAASNTGNYSAASNTGYYSAASNTGDCSAASNTGYYSAASNTGNYSAASNTGNRSAASNTGNRSVASVKGQQSVAVVTGRKSKAKATNGSWIVLTERNLSGEILGIQTAQAGKDIKPNVYYELVNGKITEAKT